MLDFSPSEHQIAFRVEAALLPGHEAYTDPKPGEAFCYRPMLQLALVDRPD